jgi:hypothetical protein
VLNQTTNYFQQLEDRRAEGLGSWPDLTRAFKSLLPARDTPWSASQKHDVRTAIFFFLRLTRTVFTADYSVRTRFLVQQRPWEEIIIAAECSWHDQLASPLSSMSIRVRRVLAECNFLGNWDFIHHFILPNLRDPYTDYFFVYRFTLAAACHPEVDPSGNLKNVLGKHFNLSSLEHPPTSLTQWERYSRGLCYLIDDMDVIYRPHSVDMGELWFVAYHEGHFHKFPGGQAEFEARFVKRQQASRLVLAARHPLLRELPSGGSLSQWQNELGFPASAFADDPRLKYDLKRLNPSLSTQLAQFMHPIANPSPDDDDDECAICRDDFAELPGVVPHICQHTYHLECLAEWFESQSNHGGETVRCCLCTREICNKKDLTTRAAHSNPSSRAPFWLTRQAFRAQGEPLALREPAGDYHGADLP